MRFTGKKQPEYKFVCRVNNHSVVDTEVIVDVITFKTLPTRKQMIHYFLRAHELTESDLLPRDGRSGLKERNRPIISYGKRR